MPIYEYACDCKEGKQDRLLPMEERASPQTCKCGKVMRRLMSATSFTFQQTGRDMAVATLNSKEDGMPNRRWKADAEKYAAAGLEEPPKTIW